MTTNKVEPFEIGGTRIDPGQRERFRIRVARLPAGGWLSLPLDVIHGSSPGPGLFLSGAIHGDELDGVEITRRVLSHIQPDELSGTLVAVPIVNMPGLVAESRYLPDRRDLNRAFPGRPDGSLAGRLAHLFMGEVVKRCSYGVDFHCGSDDRENLPQVRANLDDADTHKLALAFAAPVTIHAVAPDGSLRRAAVESGVRVLLYEAGEARRYTATAIRAGVDGTLRVLNELGMVARDEEAIPSTLESRKRSWVRARRSGLFRADVELGEHVRAGQLLGEMTNALGTESELVRAHVPGIVIGRRIHPLVYLGEALVHIAEVPSS